jgi:hypothetical protein
MPIEPSELQLGDIICFQPKFGVPEHVAMYTGIIDGKPYITHAVTNATPGLQNTILKDVGRMDIFRPRNAALGAQAAALMLAWSKYHVPYDTRRRDTILKISDGLKAIAHKDQKQEPIDYLLSILTSEAKTKFYERIKFAARRDLPCENARRNSWSWL